MAESIKHNQAPVAPSAMDSSAPGRITDFCANSMMRSAQGCTAFGRLVFPRPVRGQISLQPAAMDRVPMVIRAVEAINLRRHTIADRSCPALIGLPIASSGPDRQIPFQGDKPCHSIVVIS
jgi:nitrogenase molybdenum-iron protein NifN